MKLICPISGVPFRTYDSLRMALPLEHPVFSLTFHQLIQLLDDVKEQEDEFLQNVLSIHDGSNVSEIQSQLHTTQKEFTSQALEAIAEKNWRNPIFKLYQSKSLVMLAWMKHNELLEVETGYAARPSPQLIDMYFWSSCELFMQLATIQVKSVRDSLPRYRVSKQNENLANFADYLDLLYSAKYSIGNRYRSIAEENKLRAMEMALTMLNRRREVQKKELIGGSNIAAKWALTITNCPKDIYDFWFAILASNSSKLTFDGVKIGERWETVTIGDLRELRDWLEDNLVGPRGEEKSEYHPDDGEYYFTARLHVLNIIRKHIATIEQGTAAYQIVNAAMGSEILFASDDKLEILAIQYGLTPKPDFSRVGSKLELLRAMATWRHATKGAILDLKVKKESEEKEKKDQEKSDKKGGQYEIL